MGNRLADAITEPVLAHITNRGIALALAALTTPFAVVVNPMLEVFTQQGAVSHRDGVDLREPVHAFEGLQHAAGVGPHQAVVVEAEIRGNGARVTVEDCVGAVMQAKGVAGVKDAGAVVERKDRVGPVQVGGAEEFEAVVHAATGIGAEVEFLAAFDGP